MQESAAGPESPRPLGAEAASGAARVTTPATGVRDVIVNGQVVWEARESHLWEDVIRDRDEALGWAPAEAAEGG